MIMITMMIMRINLQGTQFQQQAVSKLLISPIPQGALVNITIMMMMVVEIMMVIVMTPMTMMVNMKNSTVDDDGISLLLVLLVQIQCLGRKPANGFGHWPALRRISPPPKKLFSLTFETITATFPVQSITPGSWTAPSRETRLGWNKLFFISVFLAAIAYSISTVLSRI